ncbi:uncharacterized protein A1O5_06195 [Cladophialophora psammophila CBS 110553]|uniref:Alpha/beta hydrolase fold-3 domain-containing protein n=1 Tax=Cladophialophora psammophila CBS 110553 TaxID=1182543 RepID=W9X2N7_9EURO|nr:uncharacterized protein A1O5_06195 [Cladophialophora psammophila CBS 110553]EXJ71201.1 hypothetical protein A1O5_06195 [Cladophialophora psammophila CBS 110553]
MPLQFDPEFLKVFEPLIPLLSARPKLAVQDIRPSREGREAGLAVFFRRLPDSPDVEQTVYHADAPDGHQVPVYHFAKKSASSEPGPGILHCHGGGMILGSVPVFSRAIARLVSDSSVPIFSVDYRLAPENSGTTLVEDCYASLVWLYQNAQRLNIDPARIAVMGESAGGGLAAGVALIARDRNLQPPLAKQILRYPMLDDQNSTAKEAIDPFTMWKVEDNVTAWTAVLGDKAGKPDADVSPYAAPARAKSVAGLPPAYIEVGTLDIFRDEDITYATRLLAENISTELHLYPGLPHGFEMLAPNIPASKRAHENRLNAIQSF